MNQYIPVVAFIAIATSTAVGVLLISRYLGPRIVFADKTEPFECGLSPIDTPKLRFVMKFYLVALFFMVFHIEAIFLYPVAILFKKFTLEYGSMALIDLGIFVTILGIGLVYIWKKGALEWN